MKSHWSPVIGHSSLATQPSGAKNQNSSGMALVIVLGMLVLVLILVVAFFSSVSVDLQSAKRYSSGTAARTLADSAVSLVISQIQDATATPNLAWASQPGMIRTYDSTGADVTAYKLYSSGQVRVDGGFGPALQSAEVPADWAANPALFTDLNRPVAVAGVNHFPIIDPAAVSANVSGGAALSGSSPAIEGCFLNTANPAVATSLTQTNPVPMPVQWMYVLESGKLAALNPATNKITGASTADPIVGRIAFWTDDETSKVNINTASEGTFWDRPWVMGVGSGGMSGSFPNKTSPNYEETLAINMPAQNEFQRYPGHPAMTCLSTVFPPLAGETAAAYNKRIYGIIPRLNDKDSTGADAGSQSGSKNVNQTSKVIVPDGDRLFASVDEFLFSVGSSSPRKENLKGSAATDKFTPEDIEKTRFFLTANSRSPEVNLFNKPRVTLWPLQVDPDPVSGAATRNSKDKLIAFCSTIGGTPYYFQRFNTYTSSSQNPMPSSQSPLMDYYLSADVSSPPATPSRNQKLFSYLESLTSASIPGLGGSFLAKYPASRDQILTQCYDFVRSGVNTFSGGEVPKYFYTPFSASGFVTGQSQIVPAALPNGTKGFGRFSTITEAALIFYRQDKLTYKLLNSSGIPTGAAIDVPDSSITVDGKVIVYENTPPPDPELPITIGAVLILEPFNPTPGPPTWTGNVRYVVKGLDGLTISGATAVTPFPSNASNLVAGFDAQNNATSQTGLEQYLQYRDVASGKFSTPKTLGAGDPEKKYAFYASFTLPPAATTMTFSGGQITIEIYPGTATVFDSTTLVQTITMNFPPANSLPIPNVIFTNSFNATTNKTTLRGDNWLRNFDHRMSYVRNYPYQDVPSFYNGRFGIAEDSPSAVHGPLPLIMASGIRGDIVRSVEARYGGNIKGDLRLISGAMNVPAGFFEGHGVSDSPKGTPASSLKLYSDTSSTSRLVHSLAVDGMSGSADTTNQNGYYNGAGSSATADPRGKLLPGLSYSDPNRGNNARNRKVPVVPRGLDGAYMADGSTLGDWDTGLGAQVDGPFINPADQATANTAMASSLYYTTGGYINGAGVIESGASFSPNRQISSAVAFGSLPTGINPANPDSSKPWQTLLFCKNPLGGSTHPGFGIASASPGKPPYSTPPDHAFLDLFTMPIVEPYAISEPFSTAGKVNMNYQILPFTYLTRDTGVRAVLKSTQIMAIPSSASQTYKLTNADPDYRYLINPDEQTGTLSGFQQRFSAGDIFRSASEICDIYLVPGQNVDGVAPSGNPSYSTMASWWSSYKLTGDNVREQPYGNLYPRLTTKSNTFTVHVKSQSIAKSRSTPADEFIEGKDQITGEFRGSFLIERYLDPNSDSLVKADGKTATDELDPNGMVGPYKFRVVNTKKFAP